MSDVQAPAEGALSIDDAVNQLDAEPREEERAKPEAEAQAEPEAEAPAEEAEEAEEVEAEAEEPAAIEAPHYWTAEQKARFAELPPDLQAVVAENEAGRERAVQKAQQAAAEARKAAEAEAENIKTFATRADEIFERAQSVFSRQAPEIMDDSGQPDRLVDADGRPMRWQDVNWTEWLRIEPARAARFKALHDAEAMELQRLDAARQASTSAALKQHVETRDKRLAELNHDLADPVEGPRRKDALAQFLIERGIPQDQLPAFSAEAMTLAYDAMRWRDAQAKAQARPQSQRPPAARPVRPAAPAQTSTPQRQAEQARNRFAQTRSVDDAVALLNLRG